MLLENESEAWAKFEIRHACRNLPKHKAEKVMRVLEEKDDVDIIFTPATEKPGIYDWQKQVMCGAMPCDSTK